MSTAAPQPSPRVTPDKEPMAQNKKIYVLDCGGQYCHLIASRSPRGAVGHRPARRRVPKQAPRLLDGVEETVHTTSVDQLTGRAHAGATCPSPN